MKKTKLLSLVTILCFMCCYLLSSAAAGDMLSLFMMIQLRGKAASPKISLNADPATIMLGNTATLSWNSKKADTVSIDNGIGEVDLSGSLSVEPTATTTYTATAVGAKGTVTDSVTITVIQPPTVSLTADPTSIIEGGSSTLTWTSANSDTVSIDNGIGEVAASGTESVSPAETTKFESLKFQGEQRLQFFSVYCVCLAQAIAYHSFELFKLIIIL